MIEEKWKAIEGYEEIYEVSSLGNIRSKTRVMSNGKTLKGKTLNNSSLKFEYMATRP